MTDSGSSLTGKSVEIVSNGGEKSSDDEENDYCIVHINQLITNNIFLRIMLIFSKIINQLISN